MSNTMEEAVKRAAVGQPFVMVTVVGTTGSAPASVGQRMIVTHDDMHGTVGGGALEHQAIALASHMLGNEEEARLETIELKDVQMTCGGHVTLFLEPFRVENRLWIFGGGHVASALVPIIAPAGFAVTVVDNRAEFAQIERFPLATQVVHSPYVDAARRIEPGAFAVIVTHGHAHDEEILGELAHRDPPLPYIGMIGSKKKVGLVLERLEQSGVAPRGNIYSPIGLNLGGNSPGEIAISIASEMLGVLNGKEQLPHCRKGVGPKEG